MIQEHNIKEGIANIMTKGGILIFLIALGVLLIWFFIIKIVLGDKLNLKTLKKDFYDSQDLGWQNAVKFTIGIGLIGLIVAIGGITLFS